MEIVRFGCIVRTWTTQNRKLIEHRKGTVVQLTYFFGVDCFVVVVPVYLQHFQILIGVSLIWVRIVDVIHPDIDCRSCCIRRHSINTGIGVSVSP
jgi:hypothetical protein